MSDLNEHCSDIEFSFSQRRPGFRGIAAEELHVDLAHCHLDVDEEGSTKPV